VKRHVGAATSYVAHHMPPEALFASALVLDDYTPGAAFTTDLVNTMEGPRARDTLSGVEDLRALLERHGRDPGEAEPTEHDVREVRDLRARMLKVFDASNDRALVAELNALLAASRPHAVRLLQVQGGSGWTWSVAFGSDASLADRMQVVSAVSLLGVVKALGFDRLRSCAAPDCSGLFVDTSRAGRRKYCQPAICGNRQNVAAYRARRERQLESG
jgi:predicted RNA-binding Zn ribbon-like protein